MLLKFDITVLHIVIHFYVFLAILPDLKASFT
jgi:hypothetical protein